MWDGRPWPPEGNKVAQHREVSGQSRHKRARTGIIIIFFSYMLTLHEIKMSKSVVIYRMTLDEKLKYCLQAGGGGGSQLGLVVNVENPVY